MRDFDFAGLQRNAVSALNCHADIRCQPSDFQVTELLPFNPEGSGGHVWLFIEKTNTNTDWLANELARFAGVAPVAVGYAGLKDRHAVTRQWFSVNLEGHDEPDWAAFESEQIQIKQQIRHNKKLKRGVLQGNQFQLRLSNIEGDLADWQANLQQIRQHGLPNYFAEQRFGHHGGNLQRADQWFTSKRAPKRRNQRSIILSAARSWLFNLVLSQRLEAGNWNQALAGDVMQLAGSRSFFNVEQPDSTLSERLAAMDIHPTGPLWGRGRALNSADSLALEQAVLDDWADWLQGLEHAGLSQERRALRLMPTEFDWQFLDDHSLQIQMTLPAGSYATAVLRELAVINDASHSNDTAAESVQMTSDEA